MDGIPSDTDAQSTEVKLMSFSIGESESTILSTKSSCIDDNIRNHHRSKV